MDISHRVELLRLLRDLNRSTGRTIVSVLHDLSLACRYSDHLVVVPDPVSGTPLIVPAGD
ncbi:hypothetical protein [Nocardioides daejeonensis]|uniref:hypothetical protein n=1 Tax=Nocardioides daejeonensis TaxID=1046556 RepID=UPI00195297F8